MKTDRKWSAFDDYKKSFKDLAMMAESGSNIFVPATTLTDDPQATPPTTPQDPSPQSEEVSVINRIPGMPNVAAAVSNVDLAQVGAKLDSLKKWSVSTFKNTKQHVFEQLGKVDRTTDTEFEVQCEVIRDLHRRYGAVVAASRQFSTLFSQLSAAEKNLAESLYQLSLKEAPVKAQCTTTGESLRSLADAAASLDACLKYFLSSMETLHGRTIVDTLTSMALSEQARIEYDVHRHELATLQSNETASPTAIQTAKDLADKHREKYEMSKQDCRVKFQLLEENRVQVMTKQLDKLQTALSAYFTGNAPMLEQAVHELRAIAPQETAGAVLLLA